MISKILIVTHKYSFLFNKFSFSVKDMKTVETRLKKYFR